MNREQLITLLHKSINGFALSEPEKKELEDWIASSEHNRDLYREVMHSDTFQQEVKDMLNYNSENLWNKINQQLNADQPKNKISLFNNPLFWTAAAAILIILITTATYFMLINHNDKPAQLADEQQPVKQDVAPGTEKATLTLADGSQLILDNTSNGKIAQQGASTVVKEDGLLAYNTNNDKPQTEVLYNTITTPKAGYYSSLVLADGSKIWLNSLSSIRFPTSFTSKDRVVEITGEAYFEVAKDPSHPFKVIVASSPTENTGSEVIEVLGTHFNINAYNDESVIKTSLLEGAIKITAGGKTNFLKPGQQAILNGAKDLIIKDNIDMDETIAWKNGLFLFKKEDIQTIMRQVSRWYDLQVVFEDNVSGYYVASLSRNTPVSKLLKIFEMSGGVHFEIDNSNKKIIVRR